MPRHFTYSPIPAGFPILLGAAAGLLLHFARQGSPAALPLGLFGDEEVMPPEPSNQHALTIPTDLLLAGWRGLFPAERMMLVCGRTTKAGLTATSIRDVTGPAASASHVAACPELLAKALMDFEMSGGRLVAWLHSHPGVGSLATHPSTVDKRQDADLRRDFGDRLVGLIATRDGHVRVWGSAVAEGTVAVQLEGRGIEPMEGEDHVYRLAL